MYRLVYEGRDSEERSQVVSSRATSKFEFFDKMMKSVPEYREREPIPADCSQCMYYQPKWKYRTCKFAQCKYKKACNPFRKNPLEKDHFSKTRVVAAGAI